MTIVAGVILQRVSTLPAAESLAVAAITLIAVAVPPFWAVVRGVALMAHEGAHAVTGSLQGGRVTFVELKAAGVGKTDVANLPGSGFAFQLVGYLGPSAFGLTAAALIARGLAVLVLWIAMVLLAVLVFSVRNVFGVVLVTGTGWLLWSMAHSRDAGLETVTAYGLAWLLLWSGIRYVLKHRAGAEDAKSLRTITHLPRALWFLVWLAGSVAALVYGWGMLV